MNETRRRAPACPSISHTRLAARWGAAARRFALAATLAALGSAAPSSAWAQCKLKVMEIPVKMVGSRPIVTLGLNGTPVPLLVDTGAFFSTLTEAAAAQLQLRTRRLPDGLRINGIAGPVEARMARVDKVQLPGGEIPNVEFVVGLSEVGGNAMGLLGRNFLAIADTEYDLAHGMIRLVMHDGNCDKTNLAYWAGDAPVNVLPLQWSGDRSKTPPFQAAVTVNGKKLTALLDTGADESTLTLSAAKSAGIDPASMTPNGESSGAGSDHVRSWIAKVDRVEIGGETVRGSRLGVTDTGWIDQDMLLGIDFFLSHRILVARSQEQLYATWNGGAVFGRNAATDGDESTAASAGTEVAPDDAAGLLRRGAAFAARGDLVHALADLDHACTLAPKEASCFATRARVQLERGHPELALHDADEALRLDPADDPTRTARARLRANAHDRAGALADLQALDASLPSQSNLRAAMGGVYAELEMPAEATHQWTLWLAVHGNDAARAGVLNDRCWMRARFNVEIDGALDDCKEAVDENPDRASFRDSLGWVYVRRADYEKAIKSFDAAIARQSVSAWAYYGRGVARLRQGPAQADLAQADLAQARRMLPKIDELARKRGMAAE